MEKYNGISMMPDSPWSEPDGCLPGRLPAWKAAGVGAQVTSFMVNSYNSSWSDTFILMHLSC